MATTKKTTKKTAEKRYLSAKEYNEFFDYIGEARVMAHKLSEDKTLIPEAKRAFKSIEKKMFAIEKAYKWGAITGYKRLF